MPRGENALPNHDPTTSEAKQRRAGCATFQCSLLSRNATSIQVSGHRSGMINDDVSILNDDVSILNDDVSILNDDVSILNDDVSILNDDVSILNDDVSILNDDVSILNDDVSILNDDVSILNDDVSILNDDVSILNDDVSILNDDVSILTCRCHAIFFPGILSDPSLHARYPLLPHTVIRTPSCTPPLSSHQSLPLLPSSPPLCPSCPLPLPSSPLALFPSPLPLLPSSPPLFPSCPLPLFPSCPLPLFPSCPLPLFPSCPSSPFALFPSSPLAPLALLPSSPSFPPYPLPLSPCPLAASPLAPITQIMGNKIYTHEVKSQYAARIDTLRAYAAVTRDVLRRWAFPLAPDCAFGAHSRRTAVTRGNRYREEAVSVARSALIGPDTLLGEGTVVAERAVVRGSVLGAHCLVGEGALVDGSFLWGGVTVGAGAVVRHAVLCDGVQVMAGGRVNPGCVLSFDVVVAANHVVPAGARIAREQQPEEEGSDDENTEGHGMGRGDVQAGRGGGSGSRQRGAGGQRTQAGIQPLLCRLRGRHVPRHAQPRCLTTPLPGRPPVSPPPSLPPPSPCSRRSEELLASTRAVVTRWTSLLRRFLKGTDDEVEVLLTFEEVCNEARPEFAPIFVNVLEGLYNRDIVRGEGGMAQPLTMPASALLLLYPFPPPAPCHRHLLQALYDRDIVSEEAVMAWADEKQFADAADKVFVERSAAFIKWLKEAEEESDDEIPEEGIQSGVDDSGVQEGA
ncbi:unnamed protein product [Closterium sp. Yama58-4]|nr:unnamed protein product [Closterium sp. Yama58-4]